GRRRARGRRVRPAPGHRQRRHQGSDQGDPPRTGCRSDHVWGSSGGGWGVVSEAAGSDGDGAAGAGGSGGDGAAGAGGWGGDGSDGAGGWGGDGSVGAGGRGGACPPGAPGSRRASAAALILSLAGPSSRAMLRSSCASSLTLSVPPRWLI